MKRFLMLLPLLLFLASPAQAAEKKDFIFRGMPDYKIHAQLQNFERLTIKSPQAESTKIAENTYEGTLTETSYGYAGSANRASPLQIARNHMNAIKKLGGEILYETENPGHSYEFHAAFTRNDKQYYMTFRAYNGGANYTNRIVEVEAMREDVDIVDADTILHKLDKEGHIALYINFDSGKATIKPESGELIDEIVTALKSKLELKVKLEGHTDNVGNATANKKLSDDRANAVMNAIAAKGVDKARLSAEGFGLDKPIADNSTEEGKAKNRRVEMVKVQ